MNPMMFEWQKDITRWALQKGRAALLGLRKRKNLQQLEFAKSICEHTGMRGKHAFSFTYKDDDGEAQTVKVYCQKKSVSYWSARRGLYKDLQFDIIEC